MDLIKKNIPGRTLLKIRYNRDLVSTIAYKNVEYINELDNEHNKNINKQIKELEYDYFIYRRAEAEQEANKKINEYIASKYPDLNKRRDDIIEYLKSFNNNNNIVNLIGYLKYSLKHLKESKEKFFDERKSYIAYKFKTIHNTFYFFNSNKQKDLEIVRREQEKFYEYRHKIESFLQNRKDIDNYTKTEENKINEMFNREIQWPINQEKIDELSQQLHVEYWTTKQTVVYVKNWEERIFEEWVEIELF